jgi:uncharacterized protein (DUF1697 family)
MSDAGAAPTHAAFLRGVNLGRNRRVSSSELRALFEGLGFEAVATFRTSGNVVFGAGPEPDLSARIEAALADSLGYEVDVFLRAADELRAIAAHEPFDPELVASSTGKLQVSLLAERPAPAVRNRVLALATDEDRLVFGERELYWLPSGGIRDAGLDMKTIADVLGSTTMRTKGTMEQLAAKFFPG